MNKVYTQHWIELDKPIREKLRELFSVGRSGITEVRDQTLISDGTTNEDLNEAFTQSTLEAFMGHGDTFPHLWIATVKKVTDIVYPPATVPTPEPLEVVEDTVKEPFCTGCDAVGPIKHKSNCTIVDHYSLAKELKINAIKEQSYQESGQALN